MSRRLAMPVLLLAAQGFGCAAFEFRPDHPLRASDGPSTVEVERIFFRTSEIDVTLRDARPGARIDGIWIVATGSTGGSACARGVAAKRIEDQRGSADGTYDARFQSKLSDVLQPEALDVGARFAKLADLLQSPSTLEARVVAPGEPARCLALPISGETPELGWRLERWGENPLFSGRAIKFWFPVGANGYHFDSDWILLRLGRWWGPFRLGAGAGIGFSWGTPTNPRAIVFPVPLTAETFPLVGKHYALGLAASYDVRPGYGHQGGWELVTGPSASVELVRLPVDLPGFLSGPRGGTLGLALSYARWLPQGGANVIGAALVLN